jgi:hypothetical protein
VVNIKKLTIWKADWLVGLLIVLFFGFSAGSDLMQSLERKAYDLGLQATNRIPSDRVAVIAIDDRSIANLGRWPWPRATQANMLDLLAASHAKVIGNTVLFFEPQIDAGMEYISRISTLLDSPTLKSGSAAQLDELAQLRGLTSEAVNHLDNDKKLGLSILNANNVLLPMYFDLGEPLGKENQPLPDYVLKNNLTYLGGSTDALAVPAVAVQIPIPVLGSVAAGIGHVNTLIDVDGAVRTEPLAVNYYNKLYPSLPLLLAAKSLNLEIKDITVRPGKGVKLGNLNIITDDALRMHTFFLQRPEWRSGLSGRFLLRCIERQNPGGKISRQDRADRRIGGWRGHVNGHANFGQYAVGVAVGPLCFQHTQAGFFHYSRLG